jgi:uncharacterized protein with gpF-like domain
VPRRRRERLLRPARPNVGMQALYRRRLTDLIAAMHQSVVARVRAVYAANTPEIAKDATSAEELTWAVEEMADRWERDFWEAAPKLAEWFGTKVEERSDAQLKAILGKGGFSVPLRQTPASRDILQSTIQQNVSLIRSIPADYFAEIEGLVMRSVQTGRDLATLTAELRARYGVTARRAALIARDQNNKATSAMQKARQLEIGITRGIWIHSGGGKRPRPKHVAVDGVEFDLSEGLRVGDKGQYVMPGEEIECKCVWRPVVPGF